MKLSEKYRPKTWDEIIGQGEVKQGLKGRSFEDMDNCFFIGSNGLGKSSIAKIKAKEIFGDINTFTPFWTYSRIDYVRVQQNLITQIESTLINQVISGDKRRMFFLDEFDTIDKSLHKLFTHLIDDYHKYLRFIFASNFDTLDKIDKALRDRCEIYVFEPLNLEQLKQLVKRVLVAENITLDEDTINLICVEAEGSARKAIDLIRKYQRR